MKLINSLNETRYNIIDVFFMDDYKWEFLVKKYRITLNAIEWEELEIEYRSDDYTGVLYGDTSGHCCLEIFVDYTYKDVERLLKYDEIILYTNENKDFHILVQTHY